MNSPARTRGIPRTRRPAAALAALVVTLTVAACTPEELPELNTTVQNAANRGADGSASATPAPSSTTPEPTSGESASSSTTPAPTSGASAPGSGASSSSSSAPSSSGRTTPPATSDAAQDDPGSGSPTSNSGGAGPRAVDTRPAPKGGRLLFVDPAKGRDDASGDEGNPLKTLQAAADKANPGDVVVARAGDHRPFKVTRSGTPGKEIVFTTEPGEKARIVPDDETWNAVAVHGSHITVQGFHVVGQAKSISPEFALSQQDNRRLAKTNMNCVLVAPEKRDSNSIPTDVVVSDVTASDCPGAGITAQRANRVIVTHSLVEGSSKTTVFGTSAIGYLAPRETDGPDFIRFLNNISRNNIQLVRWIDNPAGDTLTEGHGIMLDSGDERGFDGETTVSGNVVEGNGGSGIQCFRSSNVVISGNSTSGNVTNLPKGAEIAVNTCRKVQVTRNTVDPDRGEPIRVSGSREVVEKGNKVS